VSPAAAELGIVLLDHGSRLAEANAQLDQLVSLVSAERPDALVRGAHLELCKPSLGEAIDACVAAGAKRVIVHPFFLSPGRHAREDIPRLLAEARERHPAVPLDATEPLGLEDGVVAAVLRRIEQAKTTG
jgi:sirohydrochlorin ferrochelatase